MCGVLKPHGIKGLLDDVHILRLQMKGGGVLLSKYDNWWRTLGGSCKAKWQFDRGKGGTTPI